MSEAELQYKLICLSDKVHREFAAVNRLASYLRTYEQDMDFTPTTDIEAILKDTLADIFKAVHKLQDEVKNIKEEN